ncbi:MAG TPA: exonuclease domain-containing protein, partial [Bradyrhizobium sp.]|nr:exonuclease domain-containing protein [Bradyrhizobium sp.]
HNAMFDLGFINAELERCKKVAIPRERLVDTLMLARRRYPGGANKLDDLCMRFSIDLSRRTKHGALLDAELLAEIYIELIGARQAQLGLVAMGPAGIASGAPAMPLRMRPMPLASRVSNAERDAHAGFISSLGGEPIWRDYLAPPVAYAMAGAA